MTVRSEGTRRYYRARPEGLVELSQWMAELWGGALADLAAEAGREHWNRRKDDSRRRTTKRKRDP